MDIAKTSDSDSVGVQKEIIIRRLKERGCRLTKQREILLDIIMEDEYSCCKEIYYKAIQQDKKIGTATVYRMVNILEEIGAISRKICVKTVCDEQCEFEDVCTN
jgi:Fur family ferric uptake transcriptional regulator